MLIRFLEMKPTLSPSPDPCMVFEMVSWLTRSNDEMVSSDAITEEFYNGSKTCRYLLNSNMTTNNNSNELSILPNKDTVDFHFELVSSAMWNNPVEDGNDEDDPKKLVERTEKRIDRIRKWSAIQNQAN